MPSYVVVHGDGTATVHRGAIPKSQLRPKPLTGPSGAVVTNIGRLPPPPPKALDRLYMTRRRASEPEFVDTLEDVWRREGDNVVLSIGYRGYPPPDVTWVRNGEPVVTNSDDPSSRITVAAGDGNAELSIFDARRPDGGFYSCRLENELGVREARCVVRVDDAARHSVAARGSAGRRMAPAATFREYKSILYTPKPRYYGSPSV